MFEMQMRLNKAAQLSQTSANVLSSSNQIINTVARGINYADEPRSEIERRTDDAFRALGYADRGQTQPSFKKVQPMPERDEREWIAWADVAGARLRFDDGAKASQTGVSGGLGRRLDPETYVGLVAGYQSFRSDDSALTASTRSEGGSIGGYFGRRFGNVRFDALLTWSNVDHSASAGGVSASFTGSRWLASAALSSKHLLGDVLIEPSAKLSVLWENDHSTTDSLGNPVGPNSFSAGLASFGAKATRAVAAWGGWVILPYAGVYGDWQFSSETAQPTLLPLMHIQDGWSGRLTAGVWALNLRNVAISLDGALGGLGADYKVWSGNVRASILF